MNIIKIITLGLLLTFCSALMAQTRQQFIEDLLPKIDKVNTEIWQQREQLLSLYENFQQKKSPSLRQKHWLDNLAEQYKLANADFSEDTTWQNLLARVDIIPSSLVIAQAANESAWGQSRFAKQANNYFGQSCFTKGCGMAPKSRRTSARYELLKYDSMLDSVTSYIKNLNTNNAYKKLWSIRANLREKEQPLTGQALAQGLEKYSERGKAYIRSLNTIMNSYKLSDLDDQSIA